MKILFILATFDLGGIETYVARVVPKLHSFGCTVSIWIINNKINQDLYKSVLKFADIKIISKHKKFGALLFGLNKDLGLDYDLVIPTGGVALLAAAKIFKGKSAKIAAGVFSQYEYVGECRTYRNSVERGFFKIMSPSNIFYCTDGCKLDHKNHYGNIVDKSLVSPLLINLPNGVIRDFSNFNKNTIKILSIGRLVDFKGYNIYMMHCVKKLKSEGRNVVWTVVGDGPLMPEMRSFISNNNLTDNIKLCGAVNYNLLEEIYSDADLYVGAGTTIIEAASYGLPVLCAIDGDKNGGTTGYFSDRIGVGTSDFLENDKMYNLYNKINDYIEFSLEEVSEKSRASLAASKLYSVDNAMDEFLKLKNAANFVSIKLPPLFHLFDIISIIFNKIIGKNISRYSK